ncbi:DDE-type integrase/transposase/recombinase [Dysosmobacter welbionis]|uniref:DDE-type integrase/transposase/recombinase n=1 Tax=Dysosmobacter welbionis TaxID=2093857 RepID=UPI003AF914AF
MWPVLSIENRYLYICVILELFSRKVIAHKVSRKTARSSLRLHYKMAYELRKPETEFIFHSDRGFCLTLQKADGFP